MQRTKIEWVRNPDGSQGFSWNPIKGLCPVGCWYCYARRIYQRFKRNPEIILNPFEVNEPYLIKKPSTIFVCSTIELFYPAIPKLWRDCVFVTIETNPQHTFIVLTKLPENIDRPMPDNVWLGISVTTQDDLSKIEILREASAKIKFISFEPLLDRMPTYSDFKDILKNIDWAIIGRLTGYGNKYNPKQFWIWELTNTLSWLDIPFFMKDNLGKMPFWHEFWEKPLIQEFPRIK